jgi:hypothetical protein
MRPIAQSVSVTDRHHGVIVRHGRSHRRVNAEVRRPTCHKHPVGSQSSHRVAQRFPNVGIVQSFFDDNVLMAANQIGKKRPPGRVAFKSITGVSAVSDPDDLANLAPQALR